MTRSHRLHSLLRVAEAQEQQTASGLGEAQRLSQQQLEEMHRYREEYAQHFQTVGRNGVGVQQLQQLQSFLTQLDRAIGQQKQRLQHCLQQLEQTRNGWLEARSQVKAFSWSVGVNDRAGISYPIFAAYLSACFGRRV